MSTGSAKLPKPTPAKTTCSKLTLSFPQPLLSVSLPSLIRIGICLYTDLNQLFIDFLSQRKLNQIVEFYLDPPNQILYSDTIIKAIAELHRIEISIFNLWKHWKYNNKHLKRAQNLKKTGHHLYLTLKISMELKMCHQRLERLDPG
jgi:hypothetical protein